MCVLLLHDVCGCQLLFEGLDIDLDASLFAGQVRMKLKSIQKTVKKIRESVKFVAP